MRFFFLIAFRYVLCALIILGAYICHTVLYPVLLAPALRVDLFLVLLLNASFSGERSRPLALALFFGLLMDAGLPVKGCYYPLIYLGIALLASLLWQNLNLHTRRYQALFLGLCTLLEGVGIWTIFRLQGAQFAEAGYALQLLAGRTMATVLVGPLLLAGLERLNQWLDTFNYLQESQEA